MWINSNSQFSLKLQSNSRRNNNVLVRLIIILVGHINRIYPSEHVGLNVIHCFV